MLRRVTEKHVHCVFTTDNAGYRLSVQLSWTTVHWNASHMGPTSSCPLRSVWKNIALLWQHWILHSICATWGWKQVRHWGRGEYNGTVGLGPPMGRAAKSVLMLKLTMIEEILARLGFETKTLQPDVLPLHQIQWSFVIKATRGTKQNGLNKVVVLKSMWSLGEVPLAYNARGWGQ